MHLFFMKKVTLLFWLEPANPLEVNLWPKFTASEPQGPPDNDSDDYVGDVVVDHY